MLLNKIKCTDTPSITKEYCFSLNEYNMESLSEANNVLGPNVCNTGYLWQKK